MTDEMKPEESKEELEGIRVRPNFAFQDATKMAAEGKKMECKDTGHMLTIEDMKSQDWYEVI